MAVYPLIPDQKHNVKLFNTNFITTGQPDDNPMTTWCQLDDNPMTPRWQHDYNVVILDPQLVDNYWANGQL